MARKKPDKPPPEAEKLVEVTQAKTIKTFLETHLQPSTQEEILEQIENTVKVLSLRAKRASLIFNAAILKACASGKDFGLKNSEIQTLIYQACLLDKTSSKIRKDKDFTFWLKDAYKDAVEAYDELCPSEELVKSLDGTYLCQITASYAIKYRTNFLNHLVVPFERRVGSYLKGRWEICEPSFQWPKGAVKAALELFFNGTVKEERCRKCLPDNVTDFVLKEREAVTEDATEVLDRAWIEKHLPQTLRFHYRMLSFWDDVHNKHEDQIRRKPFTMAPVHQTRRLFIDMDSTAFYNLLKKINKLPVKPPAVLTKTYIKESREAAKATYIQQRLDKWQQNRTAFEARFMEKHGKMPEISEYKKDLQQPPTFERVTIPKELLVEDALTDFEWFQSKMESKMWRECFNVEEPATEKGTTKWNFADHISTDGVALCLMFTKTEMVLESQKANALKGKDLDESVYKANLKDKLAGKKVWYVDPGRTHIVTAYRFADAEGDQDTPTVIEKVQYSRKQYYEESGVNSANKRRRNWNSSWMENDDVKKFHKEHSLRTASYEAWTNVVKSFSQVHKTIWGETSKPRHSLLSMQTYQGKQSALMRFWNGLLTSSEERKNTVVVYGVCYRSMACGGKGEVSVPVKVAHKTCKLCYTTYDLDEFRTSKVCSLCDGDLELIYKEKQNSSKITLEKKTKKTHGEVRGLRCCRNPTCIANRKTCMVDRDGNACWSFYFISHAATRPQKYSRTTN